MTRREIKIRYREFDAAEWARTGAFGNAHYMQGTGWMCIYEFAECINSNELGADCDAHDWIQCAVFR